MSSMPHARPTIRQITPNALVGPAIEVPKRLPWQRASAPSLPSSVPTRRLLSCAFHRLKTSRFLGQPVGLARPVHNRTVGAIQLLRHARHSGALPRSPDRRRWTRHEHRASGVDLRRLLQRWSGCSPSPVVGCPDRAWGPRRTVLIGAIVIAGGHYVLAVPTSWAIWPGLACVAIGTRNAQANISAMVGGPLRRRS